MKEIKEGNECLKNKMMKQNACLKLKDLECIGNKVSLNEICDEIKE